MFYNELKRSICNKRFIIVGILSLILMFFSSYQDSWSICIGDTSDVTKQGLESLKTFYLNQYRVWSSGFGFSKILFPLFIALPFVYSYVEESENKFSFFIMSKAGGKRYYVTKIITVGISGGLILVIPEIVYDILISFFARYEMIDGLRIYSIRIGDINYTPSILGAMLLSALIHFLFGFSFACLSLGISTFSKKKVSVYFSIYAIYLAYDIMITSIVKNSGFSITAIYDLIHIENYNLFTVGFMMIAMVALGICIFIFHIQKEKGKIGNDS